MEGFGLGVSLRLGLEGGNTIGSTGQFGWGGAATTTINIDPKERMVMLLLVQHLPFNQHGIIEKFQRLAYATIFD